MSCSSEENGSDVHQKKYTGVRRRKWGKWVSEIRVPGKQERLWLGSYSTPEAAAVARDVAFYCLRRPDTLEKLNFPNMLSSYSWVDQTDMTPRYIQKVASDTGMAVDAQLIMERPKVAENVNMENNENYILHDQFWLEGTTYDACGSWDSGSQVSKEAGESLSISIEDYLN
ncbi:Ethylene-responsive transcription factor [Quillaja saponaria]|uniref:Ethylene-responsive transcription factor n=1 Tax=Quillaja saponaria TaxID=32244 RepID=A0AAD7QM03_QUISA|nr:Ethylene-responsive transcription factor [Quillaja saponaria]